MCRPWASKATLCQIVTVTPAGPGCAAPRGAAGSPGADVPSRREVRGPVSLRRIVSLHVDEAPTDDADLLWYDVTELEEVARILGG